MSNVIEKVSSKARLPYWWIDAVVIEYLDCRSFAGQNEIWEFHIGAVPEELIIEALNKHNVVVFGTIVQNVHEEVFKSRLIGRMISAVPVPVGITPEDLIPNGQISPYHFPFRPNPIEKWDPKLDFSSHFQVFDEDKLWQWKIAEFISVEGRSYGKWVSDEIDLEVLDEITPKLAELRNPPIRPGQPGHSDFQKRVEEFYNWLEQIRRPITNQLYEIHSLKKKHVKGASKIITFDPPILSKFEDFTVDDGKMKTRFHAEPVFYRACVAHCRKASELSSSDRVEDKLDEIYQERVEAVITAAACLEAYINTIGSELIPRWKLYTQLSPEAKGHLCLLSKGNEHIFEPDREPYQAFGKIIDLRHRFLHYKKNRENVRITTTATITWIESKMGYDFVNKLPRRIRDLIRELCDAIEIPIPAWFESDSVWKV